MSELLNDRILVIYSYNRSLLMKITSDLFATVLRGREHTQRHSNLKLSLIFIQLFRGIIQLTLTCSLILSPSSGVEYHY